MRLPHLFALGSYLLVLCIFEDTTHWSVERLTLLRKSFAVVMLVVLLISALFTVKSLSQNNVHDYVVERLRRVETRQDANFEEHRVLGERITKLEANMQNMDRLIYGVAGLTFAVLGQWLLMLFKFKASLEASGEIERKRKEVAG